MPLPKTTPDRILGTGKGTISFDGSGQNLAGLVIGIMAGTYDSIMLWNCNGAAGNPVYFCSYGGQVIINAVKTIDAAFELGTCNFWEVTGQGIGQGAVKYGFQCNGGGTASFDAHYGCSDGSINFIEAGNGSNYGGIVYRTYPDTASGTTFNVKAGWAQRNTVIHDCFVHDCPGEGMYVGTSHYGDIDYNSYNPVSGNPLNGQCTWNAGGQCGGQEAPLINCKIYNNIVQNPGWDGIQVGGCIQGLEIRNNQILGFGTQGKDGDNGGITLNPGCVGIVDGNLVDGKGGNNECVMFQAQGDTQITNNLFVNSAWGLRLLRNTYYNVSGSTHINVLIANNTIYNCVTGYDWYGGNFPTNSVTMTNNIVAATQNIWTIGNGNISSMVKISDYETLNLAAPQFVNPAANDYHLAATSPCIGKGANVAAVTNDYYGTLRTVPLDQGAVKYTSGTPPVNQPPVANAGVPQTITLPTSLVTLSGSATDADGTVASVLWSQISGPNNAVIANVNASTTNVSGLVAGVYVFQLKATDNLGAVGTSTVTITVNPASAVNQPPVASAGPNQTITLPTASAVLNGSASTDPDGTIAAYAWTKVSGPGTQSISGANTVRPTVSGLVAGVFVFQLKVTDNQGASATSQVTITVNAAPAAATLKQVVTTNVATYSDNTTKTQSITTT